MTKDRKRQADVFTGANRKPPTPELVSPIAGSGRAMMTPDSSIKALPDPQIFGVRRSAFGVVVVVVDGQARSKYLLCAP